MAKISVQTNGLWVKADLQAHPEQWARETVQRRAEADGVRISRQDSSFLAEMLAVYVRGAQSEDPAPMALYLLYPIPEEPMICGVSLRAEIMRDPAATLDRIVADMRLPDEMLEQPFFAENLRTPAGAAAHVIQRYRAPSDAETEEVQEQEAFFWFRPDQPDPLLIALSTSYVDLAAAAEWRPDLLALAHTVEVRPG